MFKGKITIGRYMSNSRPDTCYIDVVDTSSNVNVIHVELTPHVLGIALTGLSYQECEFELGAVDVVGMALEQKTEYVEATNSYNDNDKVQRKHLVDAAKVFEIDGWKVSPIMYSTKLEQHDGKIAVRFQRYVSTTDTEGG